MMDQQLLGEILAILKQVRSELPGNAEESVICRLDEAIRNLEAAERECSDKLTVKDLLEILGIILEKLPAILALMEFLRRLHG